MISNWNSGQFELQQNISMRRVKQSSKKERDQTIDKDVSLQKIEGDAPQNVRIDSQNFVMRRVGSFDSHYTVVGKIGQGSFGTVYRVLHRTLKIQRALKTIKKRSSQHFSSFEEIEVLKRLDHTNILKIYEFYEAPDSYYIITEIFDGRELFDFILEKNQLTEGDAANILKQILRALNYTHSLKIAHRDIKPQNILIRPVGKAFRVKIIDWGLGTLMGDKNAQRVCGTPQYCAPEVLRGNYSLSCDLWSVGAIAFVMLTGEMPFTGGNTQQTIDAVKGGALNMTSSFKKLPMQAKKFITALMNRNPKGRLTAEEALQHPWLKKHSTEQAEPIYLRETLQRLRQFKLGSSLGTAVISFINNHLSQESQRQKLEDIFRHLDKNNDGVLSLQELTEGYQQFYGKELGRQIAFETFSKLDINHNGSLEFSELVTFGLRQQKKQQQIRLREAFNLFDRDKNGKISTQQISLMIKGRANASIEPQIQKIISEIDSNGDKQIDVQEFMKSIMKVQQQKKHETKSKIRSVSKSQKIENKNQSLKDSRIKQIKKDNDLQVEKDIKNKDSRSTRSSAKKVSDDAGN